MVLGRARFAQSTGTRDKREASNRALPLLTEWQKLIATARQNPELIQPKLDRSKRLSEASQGLCDNRGTHPWLDELKPFTGKSVRGY